MTNKKDSTDGNSGRIDRNCAATTHYAYSQVKSSGCFVELHLFLTMLERKGHGMAAKEKDSLRSTGPNEPRRPFTFVGKS